MAAMEDFYWWHVGRKSIIRRQVARIGLPRKEKCRILNVGCGTGGTVDVLRPFGEVFNADTSDLAIEFSRGRGIENLVKIDEGAPLPFADESFNLVIGLDVLEHIQNDKEVISEWCRVLKKGGALILTVPAYQWLWSEHDESLHHYRRYTAGQLTGLLPQSLSIHKRSYIIVLAFFPIVLYRFFKKIVGSGSKHGPKTSYVILPARINTLLIRLLQFEGHLAQWFDFPFGTPILLIARKR